MKKTIAFILLICVFFLLVTGCKAAVNSEAIMEEVNAIMTEEYGFVVWSRYYLEDNGYHIIQCRAGVGITAIGDYYAAGICFPGAWAVPFQAYKDGEFIDLNEAYEAGLVSKEAIEKAAEIYAEYKKPTE